VDETKSDPYPAADFRINCVEILGCFTGEVFMKSIVYSSK